ncbi:MAG: hypothetical protein JWP85_2132 [Rhodoglobus sp.]|nr:hypothetical protein [Rhodoglobus sp.]
MTLDISQLTSLTADLGQASTKVIPFARKAVEVTAHGIKDDWQRYSREHNIDGSLALYSRSIDYDMKLDTDGVIGAEIGPNLGKSQGSFGIVEDASGGVGGYARHDDEAAVAANVKDFIKGAEQAGVDALK